MAKKNKRAEELLAEAMLLLEDKRRAEAIELLQELVKIAPRHCEALSHLSLNLAREGRIQEMTKVNEKLIKAKPEDATVFNRLGEALLNCPMGHEEAHSVYQISLAIEKTGDGWKGLGDSLLKMGKLKEVAEAYARWCVLEPDNARAWFHRGRGLNLIKDKKQAITAFRNALRIDPLYTPALSELTMALGKQGEYQEALKVSKNWKELKPSSYRAWYYRASLFAQVDRPVSALAAYERAAELEEDPWQVWYDRSKIYAVMEDFASATEQLILMIECTKQPYDAWELLGHHYSKMGEHIKALDAYGKVLQILTHGHAPRDCLHVGEVVDGLCHQGKAYTNCGDFDEAEKIWDMLIEKDKKTDLLQACLAHTAICKSKLKDGKQPDSISGKDLFESLKEKNPNEDIWSLLSEYLEESGFIEEAIKALDEQIFKAKKIYPLLIKKARLLSRLNNHEEAESILRSILEKKKKHSRAFFELARLFAEKQDRENSIKMLESALEIKPSLSEWVELTNSFKDYQTDSRFKKLLDNARVQSD